MSDAPLIDCPECDGTAPAAAQVRTVVVCGICGTTLVIGASGTATKAGGADTLALDVLELQQLRRARGAIVRPTGRR